MKSFLLCFLLLSGGLFGAVPELTFTNQKQTVKAAPDVSEVTIDFEFENRTSETIFITKMDAPCSCLSAKLVPAALLKDGIAPGEKGLVRGVFKLGGFKGTVNKAIVLWTDRDGKDPSIFLEAEVEIPVLFDVQPKTLEWKIDEKPTTKNLEITVRHSEPIEILNHKITNENFAYQIREVKPGWRYTVEVTPQSTSSAGIGVMTFETDCAIAKQRRQQAFIVVRNSKLGVQ